MSKKKRDDGYDPLVRFAELRHLLQALHVQRGPDPRPFPARVHQDSSGAFWVPLWELASGATGDDLVHLARQSSWDLRLAPAPPKGGRQVHLAAAFQGPWRFRDPLTAAQSRSEPAPGPSWPAYLLAARDEDQALGLLRSLTRSLTAGIRARPLLPEPSSAPYRFLWAIRGRPPLEALQAAQDAWWRPVRSQHGDLCVYRPWPYELGWADEAPILSRIDWEPAGTGEVGAKTGKPGLVLLARDAPPVVVRLRPGAPALQDLIEVADLEVGPDPPRALQALETPDPPYRLSVRLRLVETDPAQRFAREIRNVRSDIERKRIQLGRLEDLHAQLTRGRDGSEPLFVYVEPQGQVPAGLGRLLVEWSDQCDADTGLRALRYQKIDPEALPAELKAPGSAVDVHLLTTARALDGIGSRLPGLRLAAYAPVHGRIFDLLPQWCRFDLRLFLPAGLHLTLYPELRPGALGAEKLARALCPDLADGERREDWCVLLYPAQRGGLCALRARRDAFQPLIQGVDWHCNLDVSPHPARPLQLDTLAALGRSMDEAFLAAADRFVGQEVASLEKRVASCGDDARVLAKRIDELQTALAGIERAVAGLERERQNVRFELRQARGTFDGAWKNLEASSRAMKELLDELQAQQENASA